MQTNNQMPGMKAHTASLLLSNRAQRQQRLMTVLGKSFLLAVTSLSMLAVLFIFIFIARDAWPFFRHESLREFFTSVRWYPSANEPEFGALAILYGSAMVTLGAGAVAVPLGIAAAVCISDVMPFSLRQTLKPVMEMLAAIPSVAYGFFALVVLAPLLQQKGGQLLAAAAWIIGLPVAALTTIVMSDVLSERICEKYRTAARWTVAIVAGGGTLTGLAIIANALNALRIVSGTNALNVSIILGIMAIPTIVSVSEDALQAVGRELREGSYALGATRAETILKVVLPAAGSGIMAAVMLGVMRAVGETMVVWMASGNAAQIPRPWYNFMEPVRTLTATIAGDMGEADHVTGSGRYHVLFAMAFCLLVFSFGINLMSERLISRARKRNAA
ncbi:MAG: PstC family ABC transporter permease [Kiritimatiellae bacterium]|nr:PstC family ABC transporter permease [Kiritimatiellia bacterium]